MGKRIIIKGADFSKNGMESVNYVNSIFCNTVAAEEKANAMTVCTNINCSYKFLIEAELINNSTMFEIIEGYFGDGAYRLRLGKQYEAESIGKDTMTMYIQYSTGSPSGTLENVSVGTHTFEITPELVTCDGLEFSHSKTPRPDILLDTVFLSSAYGSQQAGSVKYKHIKIMDYNDNVIKDLYPALSQGKACLYDEINKEYVFGNSGYEWQYE